MKHGFRFLFAALLLVALGGVAAAGPPPQCTLDTPTITCGSATQTSITLHICAGASGAPGGISVQWKTCDDFFQNGWSSDVGDSYSALSLSGNCSNSNWDLASGECRDLIIDINTIVRENLGACGASGDAYDLTCNTCYIFRVFAHGDPGPDGCNRSAFSTGTQCSTLPCDDGGDCTRSWGYWKTHGPAGCNPSGGENVWPVSSLNIGGVNLNEAQLCAILQTPPAACGKGTGASATLILEHQLIAAMLNRANGAVDCPGVDEAIAAASAALTGIVGECIGTSSATGQQLLGFYDVLEGYNSHVCSCSGLIAKPKATEAGAGGVTPATTRSATSKSWGQVKVIYR